MSILFARYGKLSDVLKLNLYNLFRFEVVYTEEKLVY